ncbi:MAG: hypothetical protein NT090_17195, partial [Acidobacteria bacterium]|nr:hypothetical protein [Acidobacteriota bacterium]
VLVWMAVLGWAVSLSGWAVWVEVFGLTGSFTYVMVSTLLAWATAGVAAVVAGQRRRAVGRSL